MQLRKLFQSSSVYLVGNLANRAVGFLMIPVYSRYLSPAEYGTAETLELVIQVIAICLGLGGLGSVFARLYHEQPAEAQKKRVVSTMLVSVLGAGLIVTVAGMLCAPWLSQLAFASGANTSLIRAALLAMLLANVVEVALVYQRLLDRAVFFVGYSLSQLLVTLAGNVVFIVFLGLGVWGFIISKLIASSLGFSFLLVKIFAEIPPRWERKLAAQIFHLGGFMVLANIGFFVIHFSDRFFINHYAGLAETGVYSLAYRFAFLLTVLVGEPFGRVWNVSLYRFTADEGWRDRFARVAAYLLLALGLGSLSITLFSGTALRTLVPAAFHGAIGLLPVLVFAYLLREFGDFFRELLFINKRARRLAWAVGLSAAANLVGNFLLIPRFGSVGAAWSTALTWLLYLVLCGTLAQREHHLPLALPAILSVFALSVGLCLLGRLDRTWPLPLAWAFDVLCVSVFLVAVWRIGYFTDAERDAIRAQLPIVRDRIKRILYRCDLLHLCHVWRNRRSLTVVMFHRVLPAGGRLWREADPIWTVSSGFFQQCLIFFRRHYNVVSEQEVIRCVETGEPLPPRPLLLTFDDGWADNAEHALPMLRAAGFPATVFVVSSGVDRAKLWHDSVLQSWRAGNLPAASWARLREWSGDGNSGGPPADITELQQCLASLASRRDLYEECLQLSPDSQPPLMLSGLQLRDLERGGVAIGSHAHSHTPLTLVQDASRELEESRAALAAHVAAPVTVSFPHGAYDANVLDAARAAGYRLLFTSDPVLNGLVRTPGGTAVLGRIHIGQPQLSDPAGDLRPERLALWLFFRPRMPAKRLIG